MAVGVNSEVDLYTRIQNLEAAVFAGVASGTAPAVLSGTLVQSTQVLGTTGAAVINPLISFVIFTASGAVLATLAAPKAGAASAGGQDGQSLTVLDANAQANTITTPANAINGNKHIETDGGVKGNVVVFNAYNGVWYIETRTGITLT